MTTATSTAAAGRASIPRRSARESRRPRRRRRRAARRPTARPRRRAWRADRAPRQDACRAEPGRADHADVADEAPTRGRRRGVGATRGARDEEQQRERGDGDQAGRTATRARAPPPRRDAQRRRRRASGDHAGEAKGVRTVGRWASAIAETCGRHPQQRRVAARLVPRGRLPKRASPSGRARRNLPAGPPHYRPRDLTRARRPRAGRCSARAELLRRATRARAPRARRGGGAGGDHGPRRRRRRPDARSPSPRAGPGEHWFCFEQPDRDGSALATLGCVRALDDRGPDRFRAVAAAWRELAGARSPSPRRPARRGLVAVGGFAFAPDGGARRTGTASRPRRCTCPRSRWPAAASDVRLTLAALAAPDDDPDALVARCSSAPGGAARARRCRCSTPTRPGASTWPARCRPSTTRPAVARAVERIRAASSTRSSSRARCRSTRRAPHDAGRGVRRPARGLPVCFVFCAGAADAALRGRQPRAARAPRRACGPRPLALAGSTRRSADPAVDDHLGEQLLRSRQGPRGAGDRRAADRARAAAAAACGSPRPRSRSIVADRQHPAPGHADPRAAGRAGERGRARRAAAPDAGRRRRAARGRRAADPGARGPRPRLVRGAGGLDGRQRGRRVLRRAALRAADAAAVARCYAGVGVVRDSDPAAELAETEVKLAGAAAGPRRCQGPEQLRARGVGEPLLELLRRPAALADQQQPEVGVVERPEDVGRARRRRDRGASAPCSRAGSRRSRAGWRRSRSG